MNIFSLFYITFGYLIPMILSLVGDYLVSRCYLSSPDTYIVLIDKYENKFRKSYLCVFGLLAITLKTQK